MNIEEFKNLKYGDIVYYVANSGIAGIFEYQYIGLHICHKTKESKHIFISENFLSTACVLADNIKGSRALKQLFLTKEEADCYHKNLED